MLKSIDHMVLTVKDVSATVRFYEQALGTPVVRFGAGRYALQIGSQKLNLQEVGGSYNPVASAPTPGSVDICFLTDLPLANVIEHLNNHGVEIELGPVERTGASSSIVSIYIRDPDGNLIEISNQV